MCRLKRDVLGRQHRMWCRSLMGAGGHSDYGHRHFSCRAPAITEAVPTCPTKAALTLNPPATGGPVSQYQVTLCPTSGGTCVKATCPTINCLVPGLTPDTQYTATAVAIQNGKPSATSAPADVTTPAANAPALTSADPTSSTTATLTADPPQGVAFTSVSSDARLCTVCLWARHVIHCFQM